MTKPAKLAFLAPRFPEGGTVGGAETLLKNLAERAARRGHEVDFLTTCARSHFSWENELPAGERRIGAVNVHFFPVDAGRQVDLFLRIQGDISRRKTVSREEEAAWAGNSVNSAPLYDFLRRKAPRYDRVLMGPYLFGIVYHASAIAPEKTLLVPCLHDEPFACLQITREMFGRVRGSLFNSEPEQALAERLCGFAPRKGRVVGMGLDPFEADPKAFAARHGIGEPYVIYSGRREGGKGIPILTAYLDTFRQRTSRDVKLVMTGSGPIESPSTLLPHIRDVGFVSEEEKHEAMAGAAAFVHPSTLESLGIVLLEAFMAGTPALVHAGSEVLQWQCRRSGAGLWFRNYPEFEEELVRLLDDGNLRRAMGAAGREYVRREYAWDVVEGRFEDALASL